MSETNIRELTDSELREPGPDGGPSLMDRWVGGELQGELEEAVAFHLFTSTLDRDEVMLRQVIDEGIRVGHAASQTIGARVRVLLRGVSGALEVLAGGLAALEPKLVAVRSGEMAALDSRSFGVETLGAGSVLHLKSRGERFALSVQPGSAQADDEWVLDGPAGRIVAPDGGGGAIDFGSVSAGTWTLARMQGDESVGSVELELLS